MHLRLLLETHRPVPKTRTPRSKFERRRALQLFLSEARGHGLAEAWLVGSMATGRDHALSDVDLCVKGDFSLAQLYSLRDKVYLRTGVIIQLMMDPPQNPRVKVYDSI